jgi:hypothetical protein
MQDGAVDTPQEQPAGNGYLILIHCDADGNLSVGTETDAEEAQEQPGEEAADMQPAKDIKDALTQALQIYKQDGKKDATATHAQQIQSQGFSSGYEED